MGTATPSGGADEVARAVGQAPLDLAPATFREWMQRFDATLKLQGRTQEALGSTVERLQGVVDKLATSRLQEVASCPFNQANPSYEDGHKVLDRVGLLEQNVGKLSEVVIKLAAVEMKIAKLEGGLGLLKWVGFPALGGIFVLAIKGAFFN